MSKGPRFHEDLPVLERRGLADSNEQRRLAMLLDSSSLERWLHALGRDYDQLDTAREGDAALLRRVMGRMEPGRSGDAPNRRWLAVGVGIAVALSTLGAAALTLPRLLGWSGPDPAECVACSVAQATVGALHASPESRWAVPPVPANPRDPSSSAPRFPVPAKPEPQPSSSRGAPGAGSGERTTAPRQEPPPEAAALAFARANELRKSGRLPAAILAYQELQRRHPGSPEAQLSHLLLGRLHLQRGEPSPARTQFSAYLRSSPGGSLAEEALHGLATACRASGRTAEERATWQQLLQRYPRSLYAGRARSRLRDLEPPAP